MKMKINNGNDNGYEVISNQWNNNNIIIIYQLMAIKQ